MHARVYRTKPVVVTARKRNEHNIEIIKTETNWKGAALHEKKLYIKWPLSLSISTRSDNTSVPPKPVFRWLTQTSGALQGDTSPAPPSENFGLVATINHPRRIAHLPPPPRRSSNFGMAHRGVAEYLSIRPLNQVTTRQRVLQSADETNSLVFCILFTFVTPCTGRRMLSFFFHFCYISYTSRLFGPLWLLRSACQGCRIAAATCRLI